MEEEEREAQSAKLQELIRRGAPEDLQEANRLMKIMAGYDTRSKTDYRAKAAEEVGKIQAKARLLEERLAAFQPGDTMADGDVFEDLAASLQSAQPKIQKMCEEESDDHEAVAKLLEINDSIHRTVERWKMLKKGDIEGANRLAQGAPIPTLSTASGKAKSSAATELSLIDLDADTGTNGAGSETALSSQAAGVENDLLGLSLEDSSISFGQGGGISLGFGANQSSSHPGHHYGQPHIQASIGLTSSQTYQGLHFFHHSHRIVRRKDQPQRLRRLHSPPIPDLSRNHLHPSLRRHSLL
jgi:ADP-ribosylation factor-binding protein GGA